MAGLIVSTADRMPTLGCSTPQARARSMAFWTMSTLVMQIGRDIDRGVGDEQQIVERRHVEREDMADPPRGAQPAVLLDHGGEQIVGMKIALHHRAGFARAHHGDRAVGGGAMVR